jgi:hypothetical protein
LGKAKIWPMTDVPCSPAAHDKDWRPTKILKRSESKPTKERKENEIRPVLPVHARPNHEATKSKSKLGKIKASKK